MSIKRRKRVSTTANNPSNKPIEVKADTVYKRSTARYYYKQKRPAVYKNEIAECPFTPPKIKVIQ